MSSNSTIIKLNIGGTLFQTTKSTLTKYDGFFKAMLESDIPLTKDDSGAIFIDRSPTNFERILNYMRDGHVELPESEKEVKELRNEAQYYLLEGLVELCNLKIPIDRIKLNVGGTIFETTKTTLMKYNGKLKEMCIAHDSNISDTIFVDKSPKYFDILLCFIRDGWVMTAISQKEACDVLAHMYLLEMRLAAEIFEMKYRVKKDLFPNSN